MAVGTSGHDTLSTSIELHLHQRLPEKTVRKPDKYGTPQVQLFEANRPDPVIDLLDSHLLSANARLRLAFWRL